MAKVFIEEDSLEVIGNAIRGQTGKSEKLVVPDGMEAEIKTLIKPTGTLDITANGTYDVKTKESVVVKTPTPTGSINITDNGTYDVTDKASAVVNVQKASPTQFTNLLKCEGVTFILNSRVGSTGSISANVNSMVVVTVPIKALGISLAQNTNEFRFRGCNYTREQFLISTDDGTTWTNKSMSTKFARIDEYGDAVHSRAYIDKATTHIRFNILLAGLETSSNTVLADDYDVPNCGAIVTFGQPIGNGGYVG